MKQFNLAQPQAERQMSHTLAIPHATSRRQQHYITHNELHPIYVRGSGSLLCLQSTEKLQRKANNFSPSKILYRSETYINHPKILINDSKTNSRKAWVTWAERKADRMWERASKKTGRWRRMDEQTADDLTILIRGIILSQRRERGAQQTS